MYAHLRPTNSTPVCFICKHLSRFREHRVPGKRQYASQAMLASRQTQSTGRVRGSNGQDSSVSWKTSHPASSSDYIWTNSKTIESGQDTLTEAENNNESEKRRRALAVLGRTSKFDTAIKETCLHEPTLSDLEQLRPQKLPDITLKYILPEHSSRLHHWSPSDEEIARYEVFFQEHVETLTHKFTRKQLLRLYKEGTRQESAIQLGAPRSISSSKSRRYIAGEIVRWLWHWPHVTEVKERKAYLTEKSKREFSLNASEFFLLLGPDGSSLQSLVEKLEITIEQVARTGNTFSLVFQGLNYLLDHLEIVLDERKNAIISEIVSLNTPDKRDSVTLVSIRPELLKRISKLSNAFIEDKSNDKFQISAHYPQHIETATRLITRASQQAACPPPPLLAHLHTTLDVANATTPPPMYAFYPIPPRAGSHPWDWFSTRALNSPRNTDSADDAAFSSASTLFRVGKVNEWLENDVTGKMDGSHLKDGLGQIIASSGQICTLRDVLGLLALERYDATPHIGRRRQITASTGYVVFDGVRLGHSILPPLPGSWKFKNLLDWIGTGKGRLAFVPSHPQTLLRSFPLNYRVMNRLVYRTLLPTSIKKTVRASRSAKTLKTIKIDIPLDNVQENNSLRAGSKIESSEASHGDRRTLQEVRAPLSVSTGDECFVNFMLPDRPMDMCLSLFDSFTLPPEYELPGIGIYASNLIRYFKPPKAKPETRPDPPLHLTHEGSRYILHSNAIVRRSIQDIAADLSQKVIAEDAMDLESHQHSLTCQVDCTEPDVSSTWQSFLGDCDRLTWLTRDESPPSFSDNGEIRDDLEYFDKTNASL